MDERGYPPVGTLKEEDLKNFAKSDLQYYLNMYLIVPANSKPDMKRQLRKVISAVNSKRPDLLKALQEDSRKDISASSSQTRSAAQHSAIAAVSPSPVLSSSYLISHYLPGVVGGGGKIQVLQANGL